LKTARLFRFQQKFPDHDCEIISEKPTRLRVTAGGALMAAMPDLTRRRSPDAPDECWHVFYGDVRVGTNRSATQGREGLQDREMKSPACGVWYIRGEFEVMPCG